MFFVDHHNAAVAGCFGNRFKGIDSVVCFEGAPEVGIVFGRLRLALQRRHGKSRTVFPYVGIDPARF